MDFFAHQSRAKKRTFTYILFFFLALIGIVSVTYLIFAWINAYAIAGPSFDAADLWIPELFAWVTFFTLAFIGIATLWKVSQLKAGGGAYVAESMGGALIDPSTTHPMERRILNIVEEVSIASGVPTPPVYLMRGEPGINAFAAGYSADSAVLGITEGCAQILNRDELQGVVAHEFSHILNGDMKINIRLIGALFGIMAMGLIGYYMLRSSMMGRGYDDSRGGGGAFFFTVIGFGLMAVGSIGTFFGQLIKAAVSRQREFLADASAVQFTRNPEGIGNALMKIRDYQYGSKMFNPHAAEISHMLFSRGVFSGLTSLFSTHPPLEERIGRIFGIDTDKLELAPPPPPPTIQEMKPTKEGISYLSSSGNPDIEQILYAKNLFEGLPPAVKSAARDPFGARAVVYGLLLSQEADVREAQLSMLATHSYLGVYRELIRMLPEIDEVDYSARVSLLDSTIPALVMLSKKQYEIFRENIQQMIYADDRVDLFEWVLEKVVLRHLDAHFKRRTERRPGVLLENSHEEIVYLLAVLSAVGHNTPEAFEEALAAGLEHLNIPFPTTFEVELNFHQLSDVVDYLDNLGSLAKKKLLEACMVCIHHDKRITVYEAELFRAIGDAFGIPVPLLIPTSK